MTFFNALMTLVLSTLIATIFILCGLKDHVTWLLFSAGMAFVILASCISAWDITKALRLRKPRDVLLLSILQLVINGALLISVPLSMQLFRYTDTVVWACVGILCILVIMASLYNFRSTISYTKTEEFRNAKA